MLVSGLPVQWQVKNWVCDTGDTLPSLDIAPLAHTLALPKLA
jgi:hypothetical protein